MPRLNPHRLILASASPRRAQLLTAAGFTFDILPSPAPEPARKPALIPVELWPLCLAYIKAAAVRAKLQTSRKGMCAEDLILAADTIVVVNSPRGPLILNKPAHRPHARQMLRLLSGKPHRVITGICLMSAAHHRLAGDQALCKIRPLSPQRLDAYLASGLWKGKAGAYGIQDHHDPFVTLLSGDVTTVIGLPMPLVKREIARFNSLQ